MGLMDKLRAELVDIVEWVDDSHHTLVWRFPRYHNQIKNGAQLIVRPGQSALFVHQGKIADVFEPGQYTLDTKNLPMLSTLAGWKYGFDSPFKAEVYFVNTTQLTDLKWGTPNPVILRDADFGPLRVRAFGNYTLRATDPKALIQHLVGTDSEFNVDEVSELLRSIISHTFADVIANADIPVMDLAANYTGLSEALRQAVVQRVDDEYGLDLPMLFIVNISLPAEVEEALDTRSSMSMIGNMDTFQQYQMGQAMTVAAANPAGGLAGAGVGLGMGMAMAGQMAPGAAGAPTSAPASPTPPPMPQGSTWHVAAQGQSSGPFSMAQVQQGIATGQMSAVTLVWTEGMGAWEQAGNVPALGAFFQAVPPPVPGA